MHYSVRSLLEMLRRDWALLLGVLVASLVIGVLLVRSLQPQYEARTSLIQDDSRESSGLSLFGQLTGRNFDVGAYEELEALLYSRSVAEELSEDPDLRPQLARILRPQPPGLLARMRAGIYRMLFGIEAGEPDQATRIQQLIDRNLQIERPDTVVRLSFRHANQAFAKSFLSELVDVAQRRMVERQRRNALAHQRHLMRLLNTTDTQLTQRVIEQQLAVAMGVVTRLTSQSAQVFVPVDEVFVTDRPVPPRVGVIMAAAIAAGLGLFMLIQSVRRLWAPPHKAVA